MRFQFNATPEQSAALRWRLTRLQQPRVLLELLASSCPPDVEPGGVRCTVKRMHSDRFVLRVQVRSRNRAPRAFALKAYADDFGQRVWEYARTLADHGRPAQAGTAPAGLCLPTRYVPQARLLVFPWVEGLPLSDIADERKSALLRRAAVLAADLHRLPIVPEHHTTAPMIVDQARERCDSLRDRWPGTGPIIDPLLDRLEESATVLDRAEPAPVHGDLAAGQFVWTGDRLVLLDLDMFGYADPAYDAGHFLAQLDQRCLLDATPPARANGWLACFRAAYRAAMPAVSPRNVAFYRALTLVRKIYTICRRKPTEWRNLVPQFALRAHVALHDVTSAEPVT